MEHNNNSTADIDIHCTVPAASLALIDHYASRRDLYRANWLREAVAEKIEREILDETGRHSLKREAA